MDTVAAAALRTPIVLRNSRAALAPLRLGACLAWAFGLCFGLIGVNSVVHRDFLDALLWAGSGLLSLRAGAAVWTLARKMAHNTARLTSEGVYFHISSRQNQPEVFLAWPDITNVTVRRSNKVQVWSVFATGDRVVQFSSLHFMRPKRVARVIAQLAGCS